MTHIKSLEGRTDKLLEDETKAFHTYLESSNQLHDLKDRKEKLKSGVRRLGHLSGLEKYGRGRDPTVIYHELDRELMKFENLNYNTVEGLIREIENYFQSNPEIKGTEVAVDGLAMIRQIFNSLHSLRTRNDLSPMAVFDVVVSFSCFSAKLLF